MPKCSFRQSHQFRQVAARHRLLDFLVERLVCFVSLEPPHPSNYAMVRQMEYPESNRSEAHVISDFMLACPATTRISPVATNCIPFVHVVTVDSGVRLHILQKRTDRVVSANLFQVHHRRLDVTLVNVPAVALLRNVALGLRQQVEKGYGHFVSENCPAS